MAYFSFYDSYYEAAEGLSERKRSEFFTALIDYYFTGKEPDLTGELRRLFTCCKPNIETSLKRSQAGSKSKSNKEQT